MGPTQPAVQASALLGPSAARSACPQRGPSADRMWCGWARAVRALFTRPDRPGGATRALSASARAGARLLACPAVGPPLCRRAGPSLSRPGSAPAAPPGATLRLRPRRGPRRRQQPRRAHLAPPGPAQDQWRHAQSAGHDHAPRPRQSVRHLARPRARPRRPMPRSLSCSPS